MTETKSVFERVFEYFSRSRKAYRQIAMIYYDSLRDNFSEGHQLAGEATTADIASPVPATSSAVTALSTSLSIASPSAPSAAPVAPPTDNTPAMAALKTKFDAIDPATTDLGPLFAVESELYTLISEENVISRFWAVADRFQRVVPAKTRENYWRSVKQTGDSCWEDGAYVRRQTLSLLDQIHANYLVNFARETTSASLRLLSLTVMAIVITFAAATAIVSDNPFTIAHAYLLLFGAGVIGATISFSQRIQQAVAHDALTIDGLFELFSMRMSKIGVIVSLLFGGVFALVLYLLVMSGTMSLLIPSAQSTGDLQSAIWTAESDVAQKRAALVAATPSPAPKADGKTPASDPAPPAGDAPALAPVVTKSAVTPQAAAEALQTAEARLDYLVALQRSLLPTPKCPTFVKGETRTNNACGIGARYAEVLGFPDARGFYLMLVLALVAGFAERLVPDALDRLAKRLGAEAEKF